MGVYASGRAMWGAACMLMLCSPSGAACFNSAPLTKSSPRSAWQDLETFRADKSLNPLIQQVQTVDGGVGNYNRDYWEITFRPVVGQTPQSVLADLRAGFGSIVFRRAPMGKFQGYDAANRAKWMSEKPLGAVMTFVLMDVVDLVDFEQGSVVVSCASDTDWIFSTVTTAKDGVHPVAGNRGFAVRANADGTMSVVVKAVDRIVDAQPYAAAEAGIYFAGELIWKGMMANLRQRYKYLMPKRPIGFSLPRTPN